MKSQQEAASLQICVPEMSKMAIHKFIIVSSAYSLCKYVNESKNYYYYSNPPNRTTNYFHTPNTDIVGD